LSGSAWAAPLTIQGDVKGPDGKPVPSAEVRIQRAGGKVFGGTLKTDGRGRYLFKDLALGSYILRASADGMAATSVDNVVTRADGAVRVDFNLKKQTGAASAPQTKKKGTHMVFVPAETGSNMGGRWVEVPDGDSTVAATRTSKASGAAIRGMTNGSGGANQNPGGN
jgi:Carboxypeptidase regulatory-like domain